MKGKCCNNDHSFMVYSIDVIRVINLQDFYFLKLIKM
jgi:hypothetical protein